MPSDILVHHGVKGMKWGVRRYRNKDGTLTAEGKRHAEINAKKDEYKQASEGRRNLSNDEIRQRIERLKLEKELRSLTSDNLSTEASKAVRDIILSVSKRTTQIALAGGAMYLGNACLTGEFDPMKAAAYIFPNPNKKK